MSIPRALAARDEDARLPGDIHMWVFVLGDLVIFAVYFFVFMVHRFHHPDLFRDSQAHLNLLVGTVNTIVLLTSSLFVAQAVQAARDGDHRRASRLISWTLGLAVLFTGIKVFEWVSEISRGYTMPYNDFFMFYFTFTGVHLLHVLMGMLVLGLVLYDLRDPDLRRVSMVEAGATYWHMVDVVWVVLFALLYVLR